MSSFDFKRYVIGNMPRNDKERIEGLQEMVNIKNQQIDKLEKELKVYKRALKLAFENIQVDYDGYGYFVFNGEEHHYTLNEEDLVRECLKQARKE